MQSLRHYIQSVLRSAKLLYGQSQSNTDIIYCWAEIELFLRLKAERKIDVYSLLQSLDLRSFVCQIIIMINNKIPLFT